MAGQRIIAIRSFNIPITRPSWLYHSISCQLDGREFLPTVQLGTLVVSISVTGSSRRGTLLTRKIWGSKAAIFGILLPTPPVVQNVFGTTAGTVAVCSIDVALRSSSAGVFTFSEVTNLGPAP